MGESPENIYHANNWIIIWCGPLADWPTSLALCYLVTSVTTTTPSLVSLIYFLTSGMVDYDDQLGGLVHGIGQSGSGVMILLRKWMK